MFQHLHAETPLIVVFEVVDGCKVTEFVLRFLRHIIYSIDIRIKVILATVITIIELLEVLAHLFNLITLDTQTVVVVDDG